MVKSLMVSAAETIKVNERKVIRIFLVEDQELFRHGLKSAIQSDSRFEIVGEAGDGETAVLKIEASKPDVVLMDIGLPGIDGIEATRRVQACAPQTKVLMLTSHDHRDEVFAALTAGANGYCIKDTPGERLKSAIIAVNDEAAWLDPRIAKIFLSAMTQKNGTTATEAEMKSPLSQRETEVLKLMGDGLSNKEIADQLVISVSTVRTHVEHILEKLAVSGRTEAAVKAMRKGWI
jgi:two-component system, NarL family, response regulator LiaR